MVPAGGGQGLRAGCSPCPGQSRSRPGVETLSAFCGFRFSFLSGAPRHTQGGLQVLSVAWGTLPLPSTSGAVLARPQPPEPFPPPSVPQRRGPLAAAWGPSPLPCPALSSSVALGRPGQAPALSCCPVVQAAHSLHRGLRLIPGWPSLAVSCRGGLSSPSCWGACLPYPRSAWRV